MSPRTQADIARQARLVENLHTASPASAQSYVDDVTEQAEKAIANAADQLSRDHAYALLLTAFAAADALFRITARSTVGGSL